MNPKHWIATSRLTLLLPVLPIVVEAGTIKASLNEIAQTADLIFIGTVDHQAPRWEGNSKFIVTDVVFRDIRVVHAGERSMQRGNSTITLEYVGGAVGDLSMGVSDMPHFKTGSRYLVFMHDNGLSYFNPIVGGPHGKFEVVPDADGSAAYVLTPSGKALLRSPGLEVRSTRQRVTSFQSGIPRLASTPAPVTNNVPLSVPHDSVSGSAAFALPSEDGIPLMTLEEFIARIQNVYLKVPAERPVFRSGGSSALPGAMRGEAGQGNVQESISNSASPVSPGGLQREVLPGNAGRSAAPTSIPFASAAAGGPLYYCGYQSLSLVMEQVPTGWWSYGIHTDCMWTWNQFMDVYRYTPSDGRYGSLNNENEFTGWLTDDDLYSTYLKHWNAGAVAMTWWWGVPSCGRLSETDVIYNAAYSWTSDDWLPIGNPSVIGLRSTLMHELGHTWGEMNSNGDETYDYDVPTVMHAEDTSVVEDGWGIHVADVKMFRENYRSQTSPTYVRDMGVESYYASNGLNPATTDAAVYTPGQFITFSGVTVENMTKYALSNVRLRFYLSSDRNITSDDHLVGTYWSWPTFSPESYTVENYTTVIPYNIPSGTYYVGVRVTIDGDAADDYPYNNRTSFRFPITLRDPLTISGGVRQYGTGTPIPGVPLHGLPGSPTSNTEGAYSVVVPYHWSGTVRPVSETYAFEPQSASFTNLSSSQVVSFAGIVNTIPVSGAVLSGGVGIQGVTMTGLPSLPVTAANGLYVSMVPTGWSGIVKPLKPGYRFSPDSVILTNVTSLQSVSFVGTKVEFVIRGRIGIPPRTDLPGVVMNGLPGSPVTDVNGVYAATVDSGWSGTAIPAKTGYRFTPDSTRYDNVAAGAVTNYDAKPRLLMISGHVKKPKGAAIEGVLIGGLPDTTYTDSTGFYIDSVDYSFSLTIRPSKGGFTFTPATTDYSMLGIDTVTNYIGNGLLVDVRMRVTTSPEGLSVLVDDSTYTGPVVIRKPEGSSLSIGTDSLHLAGVADRYRWLAWSDSGTRTHVITSAKDTLFTAFFAVEHLLSVSASPPGGGTVTPAGEHWRLPNSADTLRARAVPKSGYHFARWEGDVSDSTTPLIVINDRPRAIIARFELASGIGDPEIAVREFSLKQSYPNPFNPSAVIEYTLPSRSPVLLEVFDLLGNRVALLVDETQDEGYRSVRFEAGDLASGMYVYRLTAGTFVETKKLMLVH